MTNNARDGLGVMGRVLALLTLCVSAVNANAQDLPIELRGYAKSLAIGTSSVLSGDSQFLDVSRFRLKSILDLGVDLRAEVWLDTEVLMGNFLESREYDLSRSVERRTWLDLDWHIASRSKLALEQRLFRAFATYYAGRATITVGRQRIAWGTGFAWNPTDLFNPYNPAAIELDEKSGIDAVHVSAATGDFSQVEAAFAPASDLNDASLAGRLGSHWGEYDFSVMAGYFRHDWVAGGDFAGYLGDAGLRGELAVTIPEGDDAFVRFTLTVDRSFHGNWYAFVEYYFNGQGTTRKSEYDFAELLSGDVFNVARDYGAVSVAKSVTPLLGANLYALVNLDDRSALIGPSLTYSVAENMEIGGAVYVFAGQGDDEFGRQKNAYFGYVQWFF